MLFAEALLLQVVVHCSLLAAAAVAVANPGSNARIRFQGVVDEEDVGTKAQQHFHTTDGYSSVKSCCGRSTVASIAAEERNPREIPLNVIMELNQVRNVSELFTKFLPDVDLHAAQKLVATTGFQSRSSLNIERKAALIPKPAGCSVEVQTIALKDTDDPSLYYYPPCTRVNRCGGCCAHDLLACQPTKTETLNFEVMVSQYNVAGKLEFLGRKAVSIIQHSKCKCDCVVRQEDCSPMQTYYPDECRCMCSNEEDRDKCNEEHDLKLWNSGTCTCQCREVHECTSGFGFDYNTCRCEALRVRTKNKGSEFNKNVYSLGQP